MNLTRGNLKNCLVIIWCKLNVQLKKCSYFDLNQNKRYLNNKELGHPLVYTICDWDCNSKIRNYICTVPLTLLQVPKWNVNSYYTLIIASNILGGSFVLESTQRFFNKFSTLWMYLAHFRIWISFPSKDSVQFTNLYIICNIRLNRNKIKE